MTEKSVDVKKMTDEGLYELGRLVKHELALRLGDEQAHIFLEKMEVESSSIRCSPPTYEMRVRAVVKAAIAQMMYDEWLCADEACEMLVGSTPEEMLELLRQKEKDEDRRD
jgi:hypothetical protein